jgi:putative Holliday junction resolvase
MRILGIDLGTKSMGLAITDTSQTIINALENFEFAKNNYELCFERLRKLVDTYKNEIGTIVLG